MIDEAPHRRPSAQVLVMVRPEPQGQYRAQVVGIPEIQATAADPQEAVQQVRGKAAESFVTGQLVVVEVAPANPWLQHAGWAKDDPEYDRYLEELERARQEDRDQTLPGNDLPCSSSSSIPTT